MSHQFIRFASPTFKGGRFEDNALPLDMLPELVAYRDLIVDLAKYLVLQSDPGRQRVPKGFVESFQLVLRTVEQGESATPVLERVVLDAGHPALLLQNDFFGQARDEIERAVESASSRHTLPASFPEQFIPRFNQFGKRLHDNEYIELRGPSQSIGPRYDRAARKFLILQREQRYDASVDLIAESRGGVLDREQIAFLLSDGSLVDAKASEHYVQQALDLNRSLFRVVGWGTYDRNDKLERILEIDEMTPTEDETTRPTPLNMRIAHLGQLIHGWFEPNSPPLDPTGLANFKTLLNQVLVQGGIPSPYVYPTPDGGAQAEWSFQSWEVSVMASLTTGAVHAHATHLESDISYDVQTTLTSTDAVGVLLGFILRLH